MRAFWLFAILAVSHETLSVSNAAILPTPAIWLETREQTACEAMQDDYCLGRYGFAIKRDGTFIAGPSDSGSKTQGRIKSRELQRLGLLIQHLSQNLPSGERTCDPGGLVGIKDQVDITLATGSAARAYDIRNGSACYVGTETHARRLHDYMRRLMTRYYPIPFSKQALGRVHPRPYP
jgi:hypothetical protein